MLYVIPASVGAVTVIVPVERVHVGCSTTIVGAMGVGGWLLMLTLVAVEIQPTLFLAVTLYVPGVMFVKIRVVFV
jgi:hypothetical protein